MNNNFSKKRKKYAVALLAATAATVATSFSPSAPWVMASGGASDTDPFLPPDFNPPTYTEVPFDPDASNIHIPFYHVQAGNNVSVTTNTFKAEDFNGNEATFNNFIVKANDTLVEDSDDIVVDQGNSEHAEKGNENGVTRKYKLTLSKELKDKIDKAAAGGGGGGAAPSKLEAGTNTTVEGDGTEDNKYKVNINPELTGITSITGDTLTLHGGATTVAINDNGVNVGGKKITNLKEGDVSEDSTDAVTGKQLHETNEKVKEKLDKTAERHIKPGEYTVENGTVTLTYVDGDGNDTTDKAKITGLSSIKSIASGDTNTLTVANNNGDITVTPVVAADITDAGDANKLATAGVVNTAITNATAPLADKNLSNITDAGKKVITGLGTEVVQGDGVTVTPAVDGTTGKKTYTISAVKPNFADGTNTTVEGDGTANKPYKYNVNPALTGITSITGDTGLTFTGAGTAVTINAAGVNVGGAKVTNLADAALTNSSTDAVTGKQLHETNEKVEAKLDKTAERHIKPQAYTVENGTVTLKYEDANGKETTETATISGLNPVKSVTSGDANTLTVANNNGDITVTPVVAADVTKADDASKLATAGAVNTAITNATAPLADKNLSNITDAGKKVITGLGTEVVQGDGITVTPAVDATTGKKTYTISAAKLNFANGTNTTVAGDGTVDNPYKYNVNPALTGITSITNATTADGDGTKLTIDGDKLSVVNKKGADTTTVTIGKDGIDAGNKKITNVATPEADKDAANKEYVDAQKWGLKVQNGDNPAEAVTAKDKAITLKASADASDDEATPKKGLLITKDDQGNITVGLDKATRTALDNAVNGSQLINERVTSPVIFVDKDGNQVFKTVDGKFVTKDGAEVPAADLDKVHTKVNAAKPMTLDNVASAVNDLTGNTYLDKLAEGAKADNKVANSAVNVTDLHNTANALVTKGLDFQGNLGDAIHKNLGAKLDIVGEGTVAADATTAANNIRTKNVDGKLEIGLVKDLKNITSITNAAPVDPAQPDAAKVASTTLTINGDALTVENKQADGTKATVTIGKDGIDAGNKKITNVATPEADKDAANKEYVDAQKWGLKVQNGDNPAEAVTAKDKAITLKASADTSDATDTPKKGVVIAKDDEGNITLGLEKADRTTLDNAANVGNTASDGRDGQAGAGKDGATVAGSAGAQGPTGKDGLNGKDLTSKVNALRNGEAGTVVYTNEDGERVVKANDGKYYPAGKVNADGTKADDAVAVTPEARLVNPDGTTTNGTTVLNNISSVVTPLAGADTLEKLEKAAKDDSKVKNAATNVTDLHNTANAIVEKGLTFKGNEGDAIHKNLGDQLDIVGEGTVAADATTAANNIRTKNVDGKLEIGLVKDLKNITSITNAAPVDPAQPDAAKVASTTLTINGDALTVENKQADGTKATVTIGKDGIDAGGKKITNVAEPTDNSDVATKKYVDDHAWDLHVDDGTGTGSTVVPKNKVITFKAGTGTIAPTDLPAGQDSPSKDTDGLRPKTGVVVETDKNGTITIGLEETARKTLDNAANVGNTDSDGRDGKAGAGQDGATVAGTAGAQGPTGKDGLNGKDLTSKVNALRNGEAGTVVFTNAAGDRLVKANDGNYYKADEVEPDGNVKTPDENGGTAPVAVTPEARLVNPDGTVTNGTTVLNNISSVVTPLAGTNTLEKLEKAAKDDSPVKNAATNVTDLHNTANAIVEKGLTFKGNAGDEIHKNLGEKLDIVGEGTVADTVATAANNIRTKNVDGKLEIGLVKDLTGITSITNATAADGAGTKLTIDGDKVSIANKQADGTTKTITIGKDGINADGTKITNLADADLSDKSTDAVTGKQLHATNERVSNLEETKLDKTDDVHVKAGTYTVDDKTGTVALPIVKGDADTATGKNVTISGIVTHAVLSETLENKELHIAGDDNSTYTTTLKDGISLKGASNFTPDEAAKKDGINIQAKATDKGIELKLSDTLTNMKGITFAPATQGGASVSLTSTGLDNGGNTITNVAAGVNDTDAVNVSQLKGIANYATNVDSRVNRLGAQSAAMAGLRHLQYDPLEPTTLMAGVGTYKGQTALALGIAHYKNESLLFHAGASIGSNHDELMANAGVSWKFGSRADETAVKDAYRQGPISSSYTLQDKVSALEAQNQLQKDEINELKAQLAEVLKYVKKG
ncbi:YadA-like family protein [Veillonella sp. VA137]|uniref:YadA-like family protein n=1 Tax=Veillonella sp. VA137 TaxID=741828 RepID=UPI000F8DE78D|nr:YadA-like family protein [Veillonella sp. VA137]